MFSVGIFCQNSIILAILGFIGIGIGLFNFCWNIIGGIIFWSYMNNSTCSSNVFNYVFASLIIKYTLMFISSATSTNNNKKN